MYISQQFDTAPERIESRLQESIYAGLNKLGIPFKRVECDPAISVEDCEELTARFGVPVVKTLFVANRQLTRFHLVSMPGSKPFVTRDFARALNVSRVSFVKPDIMMEMLGVPVGAVSPLCAIADRGCTIQVVVDEEVLSYPRVAFPDGTTTNYICLETKAVIERYLSFCNHEPKICQL